jgi:hypothetical protein
MNPEIERAFCTALEGVEIAGVSAVYGSLTSETMPQTAFLIVDASSENQSPVATLWRLPVIFRLDFPALVDEADQAPALRASLAALLTWLQAKAEVVSAFESDSLALLPGFHISTSRMRVEDDRLIAEIEILAGFREI